MKFIPIEFDKNDNSKFDNLLKSWVGINLSVCNFFCFKVCILIIFGTWFSSLLLYGIIVAPSGGGGFHFNINGLMVCEPYFLSNRILILSAYLFYFPTTMVLMYCYGTVFHSTKAKLRYKQVLFSTFPCAVTGTNTAKRVTKVIVISKHRPTFFLQIHTRYDIFMHTSFITFYFPKEKWRYKNSSSCRYTTSLIYVYISW